MTAGRPGKPDQEQIIMMSLSLLLEILTFPVFDLLSQLSQDRAAGAQHENCSALVSPVSVYETVWFPQ